MRDLRRTLPAALAVAALGCGFMSLGCASQLGLGRARTMDAGHTRVGAGFEADFLTPDSGERASFPLPWTQASLGVHHGVTDRVELGARAWAFTVPRALTTWGFALDGKVALLRPEANASRLQLSTGMSLSYHQPRYGGQPYHVFGATLPVLFGVTLGRHELVFGPRVADSVWTGYGQETVNAFYFGGSLGFAAAVKRSFELFPEVVAMYSLTSFDGEAGDRTGVLLFQVGIGGSFEL